MNGTPFLKTMEGIAQSMIRETLSATVIGTTIWLAIACSPIPMDHTLPDAGQLGSPRGLHVVRTLTHFHTPYSYDACDRKGLSDTGVPDPTCLAELRKGLCDNRVDFVFTTDHPNHMADHSMQELLLSAPGDEILDHNGAPYANRLVGCTTGARPLLFAGFEGRVLAMGMTRHLDPDPATRQTLYMEETNEIRTRLINETDAIVVVPHTESRVVSQIEDLNPDAIEIYNTHANLDPKIRHDDLGAPPFEDLPNILSYLLDPYGQLQPDFMFMGFFQLFPIYASHWDQLIADGHHVVGLGGNDSHENIFPQKGADGERLDAHRRMIRFMTNHFLVDDVTPTAIKSAIRQGHGWVVFEGLGSPVGMDFSVQVGDAPPVGVGDSTTLGGKAATFTVKAPHLHATSPQKQFGPLLRITLKHVKADGTDEEVASSTQGDLTYTTSVAGAYRAEINMIPLQLKAYLGSFASYATDLYPWIITNHVYLAP